MSVEQIEATLLKLPPEERRKFADWFYQHEDELLGVDEEIDPEIKAEILRRREEALAHPELLEPWEGTADKLRMQLNEIRRKKAQGS